MNGNSYMMARFSSEPGAIRTYSNAFISKQQFQELSNIRLRQDFAFFNMEPYGPRRPGPIDIEWTDTDGHVHYSRVGINRMVRESI